MARLERIYNDVRFLKLLPVVQWIEQQPSKLWIEVRFLSGRPDNERILAHAASAPCHGSEQDAQEMSEVVLYKIKRAQMSFINEILFCA